MLTCQKETARCPTITVVLWFARCTVHSARCTSVSVYGACSFAYLLRFFQCEEGNQDCRRIKSAAIIVVTILRTLALREDCCCCRCCCND